MTTQEWDASKEFFGGVVVILAAVGGFGAADGGSRPMRVLPWWGWPVPVVK